MAAAGHYSQETIAEYVGMGIKSLRPKLKELVPEGALTEDTGRNNRKIYHKLRSQLGS